MSADNQILVFERADGQFAVKHVVSFNPLSMPIDKTDAETEGAPRYSTEAEAFCAARRVHDECYYVEYGIAIYYRYMWGPS